MSVEGGWAIESGGVNGNGADGGANNPSIDTAAAGTVSSLMAAAATTGSGVCSKPSL